MITSAYNATQQEISQILSSGYWLKRGGLRAIREGTRVFEKGHFGRHPEWLNKKKEDFWEYRLHSWKDKLYSRLRNNRPAIQVFKKISRVARQQFNNVVDISIACTARATLMVNRLAYKPLAKTPLTSIRNILIICYPPGIGDTLVKTPAISAIRTNFSDVRFSVLTGSSAAEILQDNPDINEVICYDDEFSKGPVTKIKKLSYTHRLRYWWKIRKNKFDVVFDLDSSYLSGLMSWCIGAPHRIGHKNTGNHFFYTEGIREERFDRTAGHMVESHLELLESVGVKSNNKKLVLNLNDKHKLFASQFLKDVENNEIIGVNPFAAKPSREWDDLKWIELCNHLFDDGYEVMILGGPKDVERAQNISAHLVKPPLIAAGKTDIKCLAALLKEVDVLISVDTGTVHVAAAVNTPVIGLYGATPHFWEPWQTKKVIIRKDIECAPCDKLKCPRGEAECMSFISVSDVLQAVRLRYWNLKCAKGRLELI